MAAYRLTARAARGPRRPPRPSSPIGRRARPCSPAHAACGGGSSDDNASSDAGTTITVSHGYTDVEAAALKAQADKWNTDHPTTKVNLVFNGGNDSALQKTVAGFTAGNYPDVAYEYGSSAAQLARQPKLVDLTDKVKASGFNWDDFYPSERQAATVDGKVVGIPALVDNLSLVYNKKLFAAAGVPEPTNDWTWEQFRDAAKKLSNPGTKTYGWAYVNDGSEDTVWRYLAMLWQAGGDLLTSDNTKPAFDSPGRPGGAAAAARHGGHRQVRLPRHRQRQLPQPVQQRQDRDAVDRAVGPVQHQRGRPVRRHVPARLQRQPRDHLRPRPVHAVRPLARPADTAVKFVSWLTSAPVHLEFAIATGDLPLRKSETTLPGYQTFLSKYPAEKVFVANLDNVKHVRPNLASYAEVSTAVGQMVQSVLLGQAEPAAALKTGSQAVASVLAGS